MVKTSHIRLYTIVCLAFLGIISTSQANSEGLRVDIIQKRMPNYTLNFTHDTTSNMTKAHQAAEHFNNIVRFNALTERVGGEEVSDKFLTNI